MLLTEKYRPRDWGEIVGQPKALKRIDTIRRVEGMAGQCIWISGKSGCGKTSIARLLALEVCDPAYIIEINAGEVAMDMLREWEDMARFSPITGKLWAIIVNETHALRGAIVTRLLTIVESASWQRNCLLVGTTTTEGANLFDETFDAAPFGSRTKEIKLTGEGIAKPFAERCREIATTEGLNGRPIGDYVKLINRCHGNLREAIQLVAAGEMAVGK